MVGRNRQFRYQLQARSNITEGDSAALLCLQENVRPLKNRIALRRHFVLEAPGQCHRGIDDDTHLRPSSRSAFHDKPSSVVPFRSALSLSNASLTRVRSV